MKWSGFLLAGLFLLGAEPAVQAQCQGGKRSTGGQMASTGTPTTASAGTQVAAMQAMLQQQATQQQAVAQQQAMIRQQIVQQQINQELQRQAMKAQLARLGAGPTRAAKMAQLREKRTLLAGRRQSPRANPLDQWVATATQ